MSWKIGCSRQFIHVGRCTRVESRKKKMWQRSLNHVMQRFLLKLGSELKDDNITKKLTTRDTASDELGAKHGPKWLKGRCFKSGMSSSNLPTETYVKELTTRIKESLASELEEKMKKVESEFQARVKRVVEAEFEQKMQQNLAFALKKLGEANPNITVDIEELCAIATSDADTPITGGSSF